MFDPARWPDRLQNAALAIWLIVTTLTWVIGPSTLGSIGALWLIIAPGTLGALIWRFDRLPWWDIATWTVAMTAWILVVLVILDAPGRWVIAYTPALLWTAAFVFWLPPVRLWYRFVIRKPMPGE